MIVEYLKITKEMNSKCSHYKHNCEIINMLINMIYLLHCAYMLGNIKL
jgi:hypothetical protein